jgi:hypothetical protein
MTDAREESFIIRGGDARLERAPDGDVVLTSDGRRLRVARMTAAYPLSRRRMFISLRDAEGEEIGILDSARDMDAGSRHIVSEELERAYFMPRITDIVAIREEMNVVEWEVLTNKGPRAFQVRSVRRNVRRIGQRRYMVKDVDANRYEIRDWMTLPGSARKLLEPYI